jgi:hypothetical protein
MAKQRKTTNQLVGGQSASRRLSSIRSKSKQDAGKILAPTLMATSGIKTDTEISSYTAEFQMTVSITITELSTKQASMLLSLASYKATHYGVDYGLYLSMEFLYSYLWKSGSDPMETANERVRKTLVLSDVILSYIRGKWLNFQEREELPEKVRSEILALNWLPTERTIQSWGPHWELEKYLKIKTVPLDVHWNRNKYSAAERYSGYTKGYGNDGSPASPGKTKPTRELDGEDTEKPPPQLSLQEFEDYQTAIRLIEYSKSARRQQQ